MRTYARIWNHQVAELFETDADISELFHPDLVWVDVTDMEPRPQQGWDFDGDSFSPPQAGPATGW